LKAQISGGANFCLAGIPYWTMDIGGFAPEQRYEHPTPADLEEWRELNTRWYQFGSFCPLFRVHGEFPYREMFNIAPASHPAYQAMLKYDKLRYRLMPYIYSLAGIVTQDDYTIMRALVMDFGKDPKTLNINDQYMFGPALLVNPVTEYNARTRSVYLPETGWYEMRSGKHFTGGQTIEADAPYSDIPVFVKEGAIVPTGPDIQYTAQKPADTIRVFVYAGTNGAFSLYEDEGVNYNYEKGLFSTIPMSYNEENQTLTIGTRQGSFPGMLQHRVFEVVWVSKAHFTGLDFSVPPDATVQYDGTQVSVKMNSQY
jgi:alpha-D-xyloside xylohydrolase